MLVIAPGVWRNVCPLASLSSITDRLPVRSHRALSRRAQGVLAVSSVAGAAVIIPMRHLFFDLNGRASALLILAIMGLALWMMSRYSRKSGWCAGLCPVAAIEKLYGQTPAIQPANARCTTCSQCVAVCPDVSRNFAPLRVTPTRLHRLADTVMVGGFAGFVWGWFQVPNAVAVAQWNDIAYAFALPLGGGLASLAIFLAVKRFAPESARPKLVRVFAAAAIAVYYGYRLPALLGYPQFASDGVLVDLSGTLPDAFPLACRIATTTVFAGWLLFKPGSKRWTLRPPTEKHPKPAGRIAYIAN